MKCVRLIAAIRFVCIIFSAKDKSDSEKGLKSDIPALFMRISILLTAAFISESAD